MKTEDSYSEIQMKSKYFLKTNRPISKQSLVPSMWQLSQDRSVNGRNH